MGLVSLGDAPLGAGAGGRGMLDPAEHRERDSASLARAQGYIGLGGVALGYLGILLPHPDHFNVPALLVVQTMTLVAALTMIAVASRVPPWAIVVTPVLGTVSVAFGVIFSGDPVSAYALFFLWPPLYALYFLSRGAAIAYFGLVVVCYGVAILLTPSGNGGGSVDGNVLHHYVIICGSLLVAAVLISFLRLRIHNLLQQLADSARSDLLTGLLNQRGFSETLAGEIERARMGAHRVSVVVIQLTGLREAQKRIGIRETDRLMTEFARLLDDSTRRMDAVARTGVTEFAITLPETDEGTAFLLAEQILSRCRRVFRAQNASLTLSIGVAAFPKHGASGGTLMQAAAAAADAARVLGSDRAVVFSAELDQVLAGDPSHGLKDQRTHLSTVLTLAEVLELRDTRTASHSAAVGRYCELIAQELEFSPHRTQRLRLAGLLHDIGKVGVADSIWDKPGPLSPAEWDEVRRHPELASRILGSRELADIREWILCRHEQPDGHGYPRGIAGDEIPLESRVLAVAESYDAMTSARPYRPALSREEALAELGRYAGVQFDGAIVDAFLRAIDKAGVGSASGGELA